MRAPPKLKNREENVGDHTLSHILAVTDRAWAAADGGWRATGGG